MSPQNPAGVAYSRIGQLEVGDEVLLGPDFYAEIEMVEATSFIVRTEYGRILRITPDAITAIPE